MTDHRGATSVPSAATPGLVLADALFRWAGAAAVLLLLAAVGLAAAGSTFWRPVFTTAHLAALVALLPLGVVLVRHAFCRAAAAGTSGLGGVLRRYRVTVGLLAVVALAVAVSLANFEDGNRVLRRLANYTTVAVILVLVVQYLRWPGRRRT